MLCAIKIVRSTSKEVKLMKVPNAAQIRVELTTLLTLFTDTIESILIDTPEGLPFFVNSSPARIGINFKSRSNLFSARSAENSLIEEY